MSPPLNPLRRPPDGTPIAIVEQTRVSPSCVAVTGSNAYGVSLYAVVPFARSDRGGVLAALLQSWAGRYEATRLHDLALASYALDEVG